MKFKQKSILVLFFKDFAVVLANVPDKHVPAMSKAWDENEAEAHGELCLSHEAAETRKVKGFCEVMNGRDVLIEK